MRSSISLTLNTQNPSPTELLQLARLAKEKALAPLSHFKVGAVLVTAEGNCYAGCNIENTSLSLSICAERVAFLKALSEGERSFLFLALASDAQTIITPCGACRQMIWEFAPDLTLLMGGQHGQFQQIKIAELLPQAFSFIPKPKPRDVASR